MFSKKYNELKTFGIGADLSVNQWLFYITQIKNVGLVEVAYDDNMHLKITPFGNKVLFGELKIHLAEFKEKEKTVKITKEKKAVQSLTPDELLFDRLKLLRRKIAIEENVPAYIVFSDASLMEMASEKPTTENDLLSIQVVGLQKMRTYGEEFLDLIKNFIKDSEPKKSTYDETLELIKKGLDINAISQVRNLSPTTIYSHLAKIYQDGYPLNIFSYMTEEELSKVNFVLPKFENTTQLKPIFETLNQEIDYGVIRLAITHIEMNK